ncbi:MAG: hypothetical protein KIT25_16785 [Enhydrobacter sp.]|nr:MAG: hypothetical protein KIT25_16785 [Enhydrobacter sp.]
MVRATALIVLAALTASGPARGQPPLSPPHEVVLYVHRELEPTDFVEPLVCELSRTLAMPVRARPVDLPLGLNLMISPTQFDSARLTRSLLQATADDGGLTTYKFLLFPHDLSAGTYRYVFGSSFGYPYYSGVVSTARLRPAGRDVPEKRASAVTVSRAYKMIVRYVAQLSGLWGADGCVLRMPTSIDELDAKPSDFCDDDRMALVAAGVIKERPGGACAPVATVRR